MSQSPFSSGEVFHYVEEDDEVKFDVNVHDVSIPF